MCVVLAAQKKNVGRLKLEQVRWLAARTLLLLLVVVAMAAVMPWFEPVWQRLFPGDALSVPSQGRTHRIIVLDGSFTMATRRGDDTARFDEARLQAKAILDKSNPGDGYSLVLLGSPARVIVPGPAEDRDKVAHEVDDLTLAHGSTGVAGGYAIAEMTAKPLGAKPREVYFISDPVTAWPLPTGRPFDRGPARMSGTGEDYEDPGRGCVVPLTSPGPTWTTRRNLRSLGESLTLVHSDLAVSATIQNHGRQAREKVPVTLLVGRAGDRHALAELGQKLADVPANAAVTVTFPLEKQNRFREPGQYVLQVRAGEDALRLDDSHSLVVSVRDAIPVLVVNGKPSPDPLDRASGFLTRALNPFPEGERSPESPASVRVITPREFQDAGLADLFRPDAPVEVVFLADLPTIGGNEAARLEAPEARRKRGHRPGERGEKLDAPTGCYSAAAAFARSTGGVRRAADGHSPQPLCGRRRVHGRRSPRSARSRNGRFDATLRPLHWLDVPPAERPDDCSRLSHRIAAKKPTDLTPR